MSYPCVYCDREVRPRQHAVKCDDCNQWQHRLCNTGITFADYQRMVQEDLDIIFQCCRCAPAPAEPLQQSSEEPDAPAEPLQQSSEEPAESDDTQGDQQIEDERNVSSVDQLESSLGDIPDIAEQTIQDHSFDITADIPEENPVVESDIEDDDPTDTFIEDGPTTYQMVDGGTKRQGKKLVGSDGYSYTVKTSSERTTLWRCTVRNKTTNCKATVIQRGQTYVTGSNPHIHPNDPGAFKKTKIRVEVMKEAAAHAYKSSSEIVEEKMEEILSDDDFNLAKPANLTRATNRFRQKLRPQEPKDLDFEVDYQFLDCDQFLVGDLRVDRHRHFMFATTEQLQLLKNAKRWYADGTFKVVRRPFKQLFTVHAFLQKDDCTKQVPLLFVLMSRRKKKDYKAVFNRLKELIPDARVEAFCMDFESGAWSAVKAVYPAADIKGCSFHWAQAVMRKVATLGLKTVYNQKKSTHNFIRKLLALPFLPAAHIRPTFLELLQTTTNACQPLKELMAYLSRTWFSSTVWSVQQWSVYHQSVRTNNDVEGWHRRFNQRAGRTQLHFYRIVPAFRKEAKTVQLQHRLVSEQQLTRYQRVQYKRMQGRITVLWERLDEKTLKTSEFLKEVSSLYAPSVPGPADLPESDYSDSESDSE